MAAIAAFGMYMHGRMKANIDYTANTRFLNFHENTAQESETPTEDFASVVYGLPHNLGLFETIAKGGGAPFGTKHADGGTQLINWSPKSTAILKEALPAMRDAARKSELIRGAREPDDQNKPLPPLVPLGAPQPTYNNINDPFGIRESDPAYNDRVRGLTGQIPDTYVPSNRVFESPQPGTPQWYDLHGGGI